MRQGSRIDPRTTIPAPAGYVRFLLKRFATTPALRECLLTGTDVDEARLQQAGADVTLFTFVTLSANLSRVIGEHWPLDAMPAWSTAMQGALEVAVRSAPTVGEGIDVLQRFGRVRAPFLDIRVKRRGEAVTLTFAHDVDVDAAAWRALSMTVILGATAMFGSLLDEHADKLEAGFPVVAPPYADRLRAALPGPVSFGTRALYLSMPAGLSAIVSPFADAGLHASAIVELEQSLGRITARNALQLQLQALLKRKRTGRLTEDEAAGALGVSRRTLVRRLSQGGTSFRLLLDEELRRRARVLLDDGKLSRSVMAARLGFADPTSFSRACRRWFG